MNERITNTPERKLWYDGPNYTADAVIVDPAAAKVLLIERADTGEWAVPGGFIGPTGESSYEAAAREAKEEANVDLIGDGPLVFRGRVDDPRSSASAWIETSAHIFIIPSTTPTESGDDARAAAWHELGSLPPLYGSHLRLIERGLDYLESEQLFNLLNLPDTCSPVEGGYMRYDKWIVEKDGRSAFVKQRPANLPIDAARFEDMRLYLEIEAGVMAHLRQNGYRHVPEKSAYLGDTLVMDALRPDEGWQWQMNEETSSRYLHDVLGALAELETMPLPPDSFDVEPSYESLIREGWQQFDEATHALLVQKYQAFLPQLPPEAQAAARGLMGDIPALQEWAMTAPAPEQFVFCHHDLRPSNLAWHPEHGAKIIDWSWAGPGLTGSDATSLLIDLNKNGYDVDAYRNYVNPQHCLNLLGFWLARSTRPNQGAEGLREQQYLSALSAYHLLKTVP